VGGERDLDRLLANLSPELATGRYAFEPAFGDTLDPGAFALIREAQGVCTIVERVAGDWARISLGVHSSLDAVGLTAELARRLAGAGIPANIVAGLNHDHLFVPWDRRAQALALLA
jgi:hypothetical protein